MGEPEAADAVQVDGGLGSQAERREGAAQRQGVAIDFCRVGRGAGDKGEEETLLGVETKVCLSVLSADITELQFLRARPGALYVKEFSVWNK